MTTDADRAVFSVDFELFSQTPAYRGAAGEADDPAVGLGAADFLRETLDGHGATATFFVVSSVAERHPDTVRALAAAGHEIGSHTHSHRLLSALDSGERRREVEQSRALLERVTGRSVAGFRAPAFDVPRGTFEALAAAGYGYDSSVAPCRRIPGWYGGEHDVRRLCPASRIDPDAPASLAELPVAVMPGVGLPLTGTWLRFFGVRYTLLGMRLLARRGIAPVLYVHPWELVDLPAVEGVPKRVYVRTGGWMRRAVERILAAPFEFVPARAVAADGVEAAGGTSPDSGSTTDPDPGPGTEADADPEDRS
ncbi:polysaccharide deacetylase [Halobacteriales archaeon QS_5_70_17]|nr:MAG: polysaccharide deacetylase [Halobacteriales archaeon QS_5_70_17]